jgi:hypothetical protein
MLTQQAVTNPVDLVAETIRYATKVDEIVSLQLSERRPATEWIDNALQVVRTLTEVRTAQRIKQKKSC